GRECGLRLGEDADEVVLAQRAQFHPDREAALQLWDQVARLGEVERARRNEEDVVGLDRPVLGRHGRAFHQRQQVALHAFATDIATADVLAALGDLVDLVDEDDAVLLAGLDRGFAHVVLVDQLAGLFLDQLRARGLDRHRALVGLAAGLLREHRPQLLAHLLHARRGHDVDADVDRGLDLDLALVELAGAQPAAQLETGLGFARGRLGADVDGGGGLPGGAEAEAGRRTLTARQQRIEDAVFGALLGLGADLLLGLLAVQLDRGVGEVTDDLLDVLADVADLGEAGRLDLDERRVGQRRQPARDLGLADAGGADHQDVLGHDLVAQLVIELRTAPAVAQRDRDRAL